MPLRMELRVIKSFVAVADCLSFTKASHQLFITQPALSAQIRNLELELGAALLLRTKQKVELTDVGRLFLEEARALLTQAEHAARVVNQASRGQTGLLRIGYVSSAALEIVPPLMRDFRKLYSGVQLELRNMRTVEQVQALEDRRIDVGFIRLPFQDADLTIAAVHREPFVLVLPEGHPRAAARRLALMDLSGEPFVAYGRRYAPGFYDRVIKICNDAGFSPDVVQETGEMHTTIALVAADVGVAILPRAPVAAQPNGIVMKALPTTTPLSEIGVVTRRAERSVLVDNLLKVLNSGGWRKP
jgi:DNA-binding transcriptional LysR family regulator